MKFKTETNWCAITGAPSSGKTSVIEEMVRRGYPVQKEVARELIELAIHNGRPLEEVRRDAIALQVDILRTALARERGLDPAKRVFLDRGIPDSVTYFRLAGVTECTEAVAMSYLFHYKAVFIFDRLPVVADRVRTESDALAAKIDLMLEEDYRALGYVPIRVPVMPVAARADFILEKLA